MAEKNVPQAAGSTVAELIRQNFKAIKSVLPAHVKPERMARIAMVECRRDKKLLQANPLSLIGSILTAAKLGLEPGIQGDCWIIARKNKKTGGYDAELQIGYKGLMKLARNSREVGAISAECVYENDTFNFRFGTDPHINHIPAQGDKGKITHVYAVGHLVTSGDWQFRVFTTTEINSFRDRYSASKDSGFSPWKNQWEEMAKKTVIRALCKYLPSSIELQQAITLDEKAEVGIPQNNALELAPDFDVDDKDI